ncbi:MAG: glycosyltransferase family 9 protein [Thermodesulfobacteriota bacterium]
MMKILIVKLSSLGDVVHTLPALASMRGGYPDAEIDWLVEDESKSILDANPLISHVVAIKKRGFRRAPATTQGIVRWIRARRYDMVLDFQGLMKSGIWLAISRSGRRIGFDRGRELSHLFLNEKLPPYNRDRHAVDRYLDLARYAGGVGGAVKFPIFFTYRDQERVFKLLADGGIGRSDGFVVVAPKARWETKLWGAERFGQVASDIVEGRGMKVVVVGGPNDREYGEEIASHVEGILNLAGMTTIKELAFLMKWSRLVISVDSGPLHIAAAVGVPVIAIFGPTAPWRTGPYGENNLILTGGIECSPCFSRRCSKSTLECMAAVTVKRVMEGVEALLKSGEETNISSTSGEPVASPEALPEKSDCEEEPLGYNHRD